MIHMLSRFNLKEGSEFSAFKENYSEFYKHAKKLGLVEATGEIGKRMRNTPMDTDAEDAREYYSVMSFKNRTQLDRAYAYMESGNQNNPEFKHHSAIICMVEDPVFTCWQD